MDEARQKLAKGIQAILESIAPIKGKAILFGSRARGDAKETSDWDILVLLDKERITAADMDEISYPIHEIGWGIDEMVNPIMYTMREWESKKGTPFYENVMKEGIALWA